MLRRTQAIHADNVCTSVYQGLGSFARTFPFRRDVLIFKTDRDHHRQTCPLRSLYCDQRFAEPGKSLTDDEICPFGYLHCQLLVEGRTHSIFCGGAVGVVHPRQAEVARYQVAFASYLLGNTHGSAVEVLQTVLLSDRGEFVPTSVKGERLQHLRASLAKFNVELTQSLGIGKRHLGGERSCTNPAALLEFQQVAAVPQNRTFF